MSSIWTIRRSATDTKLSGLCAGVAQHWAVDPVLVRVGCALLALSGGIGVVLYVAGWLLIPVEGQDKSRLDDLIDGQARTLSREAWLVIVAVLCIAAFPVLGVVAPFGFGPAVIVAAIWYFGYHRNRQPAPSAEPPAQGTFGPATHAPMQFATSPGPATEFTVAADAWRRRVEEHLRASAEPAAGAAGRRSIPQSVWLSSRSTDSGSTGQEPLPGSALASPSGYPYSAEEQARMEFLAHPDPVGLYAEPAEPSPTPVVPRSRSRSARQLRLVGLVAVGLALATMAVIERVWVPVPAVGYLGAALLMVGLTLVAATWFGRARGVLMTGLLLAVGVLATTVTGPLHSMEDWRPKQIVHAPTELPTAPLTQDFGKLELNLSKVAMESDATVTAHVDIGSLVVTIPPNVNVVVRYDVDAGVVATYGSPTVGGTDLVEQVTPGEPIAGAPTLTLKLSVDQGELRVDR